MVNEQLEKLGIERLERDVARDDRYLFNMAVNHRTAFSRQLEAR